ncbi:hypothetical protein RR48_08738 [Papilio machaon]|uniref:Uncharacterized protein n=1 Tax=Papilio machaon TaxID=76193 RepID=A0A194RI59_PAPMA|nr:hypothetical protein RR48_08738 [Papilio machaon]
MARKLLLRQFKQLRSLRRFTTSVNLKNQEQYVIKSPLEDVIVPDMRFLDRLWLESPSFVNHVAISITWLSYSMRGIPAYGLRTNQNDRDSFDEYRKSKDYHPAYAGPNEQCKPFSACECYDISESVHEFRSQRLEPLNWGSTTKLAVHGS